MASHEIMNITSLAQHLDHHHHDHDESDDHDALSFCDLTMDNDEHDLPTSEESYEGDDQEEDELFEFMTSPEAENSRTDKIVFCGKTITPRKQPEDDGGSDVRYPRKGLVVVRRRESFKKSHSSGASRSSSFRFGGLGGAKAAASPVETGGYYRSSSGCGGGGGGGSRKQKVFIGLVMRLEPKMELSEIRKRQGRRSPAPLFPSTGSAAGGRGGRSSGSCRRNWGSLLCRAHFVSALTKASFGCISH